MMKRSSIDTSSVCVVNKKQKSASNVIIQSSPTKAVTCLEDLPNELFYHIFEYLDGNDMMKAFSNLNHRFENLANEPFLPFTLTYHYATKMNLEDYCRQIILPNKHRLRSLHFSKSSSGRHYFDFFIFDASFEQLESVTLSGVCLDKIPMVLFYLNSLPRLYSLDILVTEEISDEDEEQALFSTFLETIKTIYRLILSLRVLRSLRISIEAIRSSALDPITISLPNVINQKPTSIKNFDIQHNFSPKQLLGLLHFMPNIHYLKCFILGDDEPTDIIREKLNLSHLKRIVIEDSELSFNQLEALMQSIGHSVESLELRTNIGELDYLDAARWERLIKKHMPHLKIFQMKCDVISQFELISIHDFVDQFNSEFWIEHNWFTDLDVSTYSMEFHIHPQRKQWFEAHQEMENKLFTVQSPCCEKRQDEKYKSPRFIGMTTEYLSSTNKKPEWQAKLKHVFQRVPVRQYSIGFCDSLEFLFEMINELTHLDSLVLVNIPNIDMKPPSGKIAKDQFIFAHKNRITKVKIEAVTAKEQIQYVMNLFPRMEYLEMFIKTETLDAVSALKVILTTCLLKVPNLRSICFGVKIADRHLLQDLARVIEHGSLIRKYHLETVQNRIYFQWARCDA